MEVQVMRRTVYLIALGLAIGFVSFSVARKAVVMSQEVRATAFTATVKVTGLRHDGTVAYTKYYQHGARSDGSWVDLERKRDPNGHWSEGKILLSLTEKRRITVDGLTDSLTTYPLSEGDISVSRAIASSCVVNPATEHGNILGYEVVKVADDPQIGSGQLLHHESWQAPALGCFELSRRSTLGSLSGPPASVVVEVLAVTEGEPPSSWFSLPANFVERSPSQVFAEFSRRFPSREGAPASASFKLDQAYASSQANR
jgi:hypothetical protein